MSNRIIIPLSALILAIIFSAVPLTNVSSQDNFQQQVKTLFAPLPAAMESKDNPITPEKTHLGKMLFFETRISVDRTVSCSKCHLMSLYATDGLKKAVGNNCKLNPRNAPTVLNAADQISEHWIGNRVSVEDQAKQSLIAPLTFGLSSYKDVELKLKAIPGYDSLFRLAFPGEKDPVNADNFALAVGAWERTLVTPGRFDMYVKGDTTALTRTERDGLALFIKTGCVGCHSGPYLGGTMHDKFGPTQPYWNLTHSEEIDVGRFAVTKKEEDKYVFKVPNLRNVAMTSPYFHDGSVSDMKSAVKIMAQLEVNTTFDDKQADLIVAFLKSLTGQLPEDALTVPILPPEN